MYREKWYWKVWDLFVYDIPSFLKNIWLFRKNLWKYRWYSGDGSILPWIKTAVDDMSWRIEKNGLEVEESRMKKVAKMRRLSYLLEVKMNDEYLEMAEKELGEIIYKPWEFEPINDEKSLYKIKVKNTPEEEKHNDKVYQRSFEIEKEHWEEIISIIKGPDYDEIRNSGKDFDEQYDGSDIRAWWD